jgi:hypothetical protein
MIINYMMNKMMIINYMMNKILLLCKICGFNTISRSTNYQIC